MSFLFKKRMNNKMKKQLVDMYWAMMDDRYATNQQLYYASRRGDRLSVESGLSRLSCLHQYAVMLYKIMNEKEIYITGERNDESGRMDQSGDQQRCSEHAGDRGEDF